MDIKIEKDREPTYIGFLRKTFLCCLDDVLILYSFSTPIHYGCQQWQL